MIIALQCCPHDSAQAIELTRLICDIEPAPRKNITFCVAGRRGTSDDHLGEIARLATVKFKDVWVVRGERRGEGWPEGPNDLWAETMMRVSLANRKENKHNGVLTFEPDCVPLRADWLDVLEACWEAAFRRGKDIVGHAHGEPPDHINGNAIFRIGLLRRLPQLNSAHRRKGWDHFHGPVLLGLGEDVDAITQAYALRDYDRAYLEAVRKNGAVPALFHGVKGMDGIRFVREMLKDGVLAENAKGPIGGWRCYQYVKPEDRKPAPLAENSGEFSGSL